MSSVPQPATPASIPRPRTSDRLIRRLVPSTAVLSRNRLLMWPLDLLDAVLCRLLGDRLLPPNRLRVRVGVNNRILFNQLHHRGQPVNFWIDTIGGGYAGLDSDILDVGCGCGRFAAVLAGHPHWSSAYRGRYTGIDVDREMIDWNRAHFPPEQFHFICAADYSSVYNPDAPRDADPQDLRWPLDDETQDFAYSVSLFTHLLADDLERICRETYRVLRPGGLMQMTVFCREHVATGGRWTFRHQRGAAWVENERYPEAAVAYDEAYLTGLCTKLGFERAEVEDGQGGQSVLRAWKRAE
ncbi:MAG: class I SAM-dependent methyltransferase [Planctomycetota bacterium]|jgi:SAM-dependent methyltransferase